MCPVATVYDRSFLQNIVVVKKQKDSMEECIHSNVSSQKYVYIDMAST